MTERRADDATRDVMAWLKCEYMQEEVGNDFEGVVTAVTGFGLFVEIKDVYVEGLVHITALPKDYYHFEAAKQRMVGERTNKVFRLGDQLKVKVVAVNLDDRKIDFELVETIASAKKDKGRSSHTPRGKKVDTGSVTDTKKSPARKSRKSEFDEDTYTTALKKAAARPEREAVLNVDLAPSDTKPKRKPKKVKSKAVGDNVKVHMSAAEREVAALNKGSKGVSNRAKKRKAKKVLKKSVKRQQQD